MTPTVTSAAGVSNPALGGDETLVARHHLGRFGIDRNALVEPLPGRRRIFRVEPPGASPLILKIEQGSSWATSREYDHLRALRDLRRDPQHADLTPRHPAPYAALPDGSAHTQSLIEGHVALSANWIQTPSLIVDAARQMRQLHQLPLDRLDPRIDPAPFPIVANETMSLSDFAEGPGVSFAGLVAATQALAPHFAGLKTHWTSNPTAVHGDLHRHNILGAHTAESVTFIDWESLGIGDPASDVGSLLGQVIMDALVTQNVEAPFVADGRIVCPPARLLLNEYFHTIIPPRRADKNR